MLFIPYPAYFFGDAVLIQSDLPRSEAHYLFQNWNNSNDSVERGGIHGGIRTEGGGEGEVEVRCPAAEVRALRCESAALRRVHAGEMFSEDKGDMEGVVARRQAHLKLRQAL